MDHEAANEALVRRFYEAFETGDLEAGLALLDDEVEWHFQGPEGIPYAGTFHGIEGVRSFMTSIGEHVEAETFVVDEVFSCGDRVVALGHERMRVKATDRSFEMAWADVYRIRDGKITHFAEYTDTGAMLLAYLGG